MYRDLRPGRDRVWDTFDELAYVGDMGSIDSLHRIENLTLDEVLKVGAISSYTGCGKLQVVKWIVATFNITRDQIDEDDFADMCVFTASQGHCGTLRWIFNTWGLPDLCPPNRPWYVEAVEDAASNGHVEMVALLTRKFHINRYDVLPFSNRSFDLAITGGHVRLVTRMLGLYKLHQTEREKILYFALMHLSSQPKLYHKFADPRKYHKPVIAKKKKVHIRRAKKIYCDVDLTTDVNSDIKFMWVKFLVQTLGIPEDVVRQWLHSQADSSHPRTKEYLEWLMTKGTARTAPPPV